MASRHNRRRVSAPYPHVTSPLLDPWRASNVQWITTHQPPTTEASYAPMWKKFVSFCLCNNRSFLPASPDTVIMFMRSLLAQGLSRGYINGTAPAAIRRYHTLGGFPVPTVDDMVILAKRVVTRHTKAPTSKLPVTTAQLKQMTVLVRPSYSSVRDMFMMILMFFAFLRRSEVVSLEPDHTWIDHDAEGSPILNVFVQKSKTDQGRNGDLIVLAANPVDFWLCPVQWFEYFSTLRAPSAPYVFHSSLARSDLGKKLALDVPNDRIKHMLVSIGVDPAPYGSHSCRRGGATHAAAKGVSERLIKRHGRWKSDCVRLYITDTQFAKLSVSRWMYAD